MSQPFRNTPSLLRFLEKAPLAAIRLLFERLATQDGFETLTTMPWPNDADLDEAHRGTIVTTSADLPAKVRNSLDGHARQIIRLSEEKGPEALQTVSDRLYTYDSTELSITDLFAAQPDALGRATVLFALTPELFGEAERFFYAEYHRNFGKMYEAFAIDSDGTPELDWNDAAQARLEQALKDRMNITGPCKVQYIPVQRETDDGKTMHEHFFLVRHAGDKSSVQDTKPDLTTQPIYYTPPVEATIILQPHTRMLEVLCQDRSIRAALATTFASQIIQSPLSERPVTLRQYNLRRFYTSLALPQEDIADLDVIDVRVVEAEARPQNDQRRVIVKVDKTDDIEAAIQDIFGGSNLFHGQSGSITRIVINVQFMKGEKRVNLPITLSTPNRCNLVSREDPMERDIGMKILERYDILTPVMQLDESDEARVFDPLLKLFESGQEEVRLKQLQEWGADVAMLQAGGFLRPMLKATNITLTTDEGYPQTLDVQHRGQNLVVVDPVTNNLIDVDPDELVRFQVMKRWVAERVIKSLGSEPVRRSDAPVADLGKLTVGTEAVSLYLARQVRDAKHRNLVEAYLRGQGQTCYGIVFTATDTFDEYLGSNVVIGLRSVMTITDDEIVIDWQRVREIWQERRHRATAAAVVELVRSQEDPDGSATLQIPGKPPWSIYGDKQVKVVDRLVNAHHSVNPVLQASQLFDGLGSKNPNQLFGKDQTWKTYIGHPAGQSRGWTLLT